MNDNINPNDPYNSEPQSPNPTPPQPARQYAPPAALPEEMSVGRWLLTLLIQSIPFVGLIMLFIWGFGDPSPRRNYSRASLLWALITAVVSTVLAIIVALISFSMVRNGVFDEYFNSYFYGGF